MKDVELDEVRAACDTLVSFLKENGISVNFRRIDRYRKIEPYSDRVRSADQIEKLAINVRYLRKIHGYTVRGLANRIGVGTMTISRVENGNGIMMENVVKIAEFFDIDVNRILNEIVSDT